MVNQILPSLLAADFGNLEKEILRAESSGADQLHLDIMDGHFVPNISFGPDMVSLAQRVAPGFYRNVHLMLSRPDLYISKFAEAGAQTLQIHVEADCDIGAALASIRQLGLKNAIVLNPETRVEEIFPYLSDVDGVLVMTVHPGYGGQKFIPQCLSKVRAVREREPALDIMVDGGCNYETIALAREAGANQFVAGSFLFAHKDMALAVQKIKAGF